MGHLTELTALCTSNCIQPSWGRTLLQKRRESFWWISYGFWKRRLGDQGRRETRAWLVLPFARTSTVLRLSRKSPDVSSLWNGKKNNSCLVSPLLSKRWGVNFLQSWRERRENPKHTCGHNTYLRLSLWLPHSMAAASKSKGTKRQPGGADIACCDQVFQY